MAEFEQQKVVTVTCNMETRPCVGTSWEWRQEGGGGSNYSTRYIKADIIQDVIATMGDEPIDGLGMEQMCKHITECADAGHRCLSAALQEGLDKWLEERMDG